MVNTALKAIWKNPKLSPYYRDVINFVDYLEKTSKMRLKFNMFNTYPMESKSITVPYVHRWTDGYSKPIYARLKKLEKWYNQNDVFATMMTLTVYQRNHTISECLDNLQEHKKSLIANLRYIRSQIGYLEYLWIIEPHKSGYPHLHMMIFTKEDFMPYEERLQNLWAEKYGAASKEHGLKLGSHDSKGESKRLDFLTQYIFKYLGKSIVSENSFDDDKSNDMMSNPAILVFHSQVFKKFKPVKRKRGVKKMKDGTHRTFSLGRGSYRLWDSSRGLKNIMRMEKKENWNNCLSVEMIKDESEESSTNVYKTANEGLLKQIYKRNMLKASAELEGVFDISKYISNQ